MDDRLPLLALGLGGLALFLWSILLARAARMYVAERRTLMVVMYLTGWLASLGMFGSAVGFSISSGLWSPDYADALRTGATFVASAGRAALIMAGLYLLIGQLGVPPKER